MKKKCFLIVAVLGMVITVVANVNLNSDSQNGKLSNVSLANVEALTVEQPNVNECIYSPYNTCEALHPTNPALDKTRSNAIWP
jgi:hypothetical protein